MVRRDMAFVPKEQMYFIPRNLRTQRRIIYKKAVERFRRRTSSQRHIEGAFDAYCFCRGLNEFPRSVLGDGRTVRQDSNLTLHARSSQEMIPVLSVTPLLR